MNKKNATIIIGVIIIAIGVIILASTSTIQNNLSEKPSIPNATNPVTGGGKHFEVELNESVGIKTKS